MASKEAEHPTTNPKAGKEDKPTNDNRKGRQRQQQSIDQQRRKEMRRATKH
jgi:hypothetical protein